MVEQKEEQVKQTKPVVVEDPEGAEKLKQLGNAELKAGNFDKAIELYTEAVGLHRNEAILSNRAVAYISKRMFKEALHDVEQCLFIKPDFAKAHVRAFTCYLQTGEFEKAEQSIM